MKHNTFNKLIEDIEAKLAFKALTVLDRGQEIILVRTTTNLWYLYQAHKWREVTPNEADKLCTANYFPNRFVEMLS